MPSMARKGLDMTTMVMGGMQMRLATHTIQLQTITPTPESRMSHQRS
jgi:hypothetical protein